MYNLVSQTRLCPNRLDIALNETRMYILGTNARILSRKDYVIRKPSGETTKTARQQVKQASLSGSSQTSVSPHDGSVLPIATTHRTWKPAPFISKVGSRNTSISRQPTQNEDKPFKPMQTNCQTYDTRRAPP